MQTSYSMYMNAGNAGTKYDLSFSRVDSYAAENTVYPGRAVINGTKVGEQVKTPLTTGDFVGVAMLQAKEKDSSGEIKYNAGETVPVLNKGRIWVEVSAPVAVGSSVYYHHSGDNAGKFTGTSDTTGSTTTAVPGAKFITAASDAGIAVLELN